MTKSEILENEILECKANGITGKRTIAKLLVEKYPEHFTNIDNARSMVRLRTGAHANRGGTFEAIKDKFIDEVGSEYDVAKAKKTIKTGCYIITSAVNNTPINTDYWNNILAYAAVKNAQVHVIALRYNNVNSIKNENWAEDVMPYLDANRHNIHKHIDICSDVKVVPTMENPISGLEGISADKSCIIGHPRLQMSYLPIIKGATPKMMLTTGCVTLPKYTDSKAGKKGEFHHTYGFTIIEFDSDDAYNIRYVTAHSDGSFIDQNISVKNSKVFQADRAKAIIFGDIHVAKLTGEALDRMVNLIDKYNPETIVLHDVFDGDSVNPHKMNDPIKAYKNIGINLNSEIEDALNFIAMLRVFNTKIVVVASNHDAFLDRYIASMDWKKDVVNAKTYASLAIRALESVNDKSLIANIINEHFPDVVTLDLNDSYKIGDIEVGQHGHIGANGSRGSAQQYRKLSTKIITGHTHAPSRIDGHLTVGCQNLDHGYNKGLSSWGIADVVINADGKTQHILH